MEEMTTASAAAILKTLHSGDKASIDAGADVIDYIVTFVGGVRYLVCLNSGSAMTVRQLMEYCARFDVETVHVSFDRLPRRFGRANEFWTTLSTIRFPPHVFPPTLAAQSK